MPYDFEVNKIPMPKDKAYKLRESDRILIKELHRKGHSIRAIARTGICSRRMIQFILFPDRYEKALKRRQINGAGQKYYKKEKQKEYIKKWRRKKKGALKCIK